MSKHERARDCREYRAYERLGTRTPRCAACGEPDWRCHELHHVAGRKHDPRTVILCANCHRKASDAQKDHPPPVADGDALLERIGRFLLGLADMLALVIERLVEFGEALIERARTNGTPDREVRS